MNLVVVTLLAFGPLRSPSPGVPNTTPNDLKGLQVEEHLGEMIATDVTLKDPQGRPFSLRSFLRQGKPVILSFAYYSCTMLCPMVLYGIAESIRGVGLTPGKDFRLLTVSFDPQDTPADAAKASKTYRKGLVDSEGWVFAVGDSASVRQLAQSVGFPYRKVQDNPVMFAHPAVIMMLTPEGRVSRYFYGVNYNPTDLKLAILEGGKGKIGGITARVLLYCYRYDPNQGKYTLLAWRVMQLAGGLSTLLIGLLIGGLWIRERRRNTYESP